MAQHSEQRSANIQEEFVQQSQLRLGLWRQFVSRRREEILETRDESGGAEGVGEGGDGEGGQLHRHSH